MLGVKVRHAGDIRAAGIVMLFVYRHISVRDIRPWLLQADCDEGFLQHKQWIEKVHKIVKEIPKTSVLRKMLERRPEDRIRAQALIESQPIPA